MCETKKGQNEAKQKSGEKWNEAIQSKKSKSNLYSNETEKKKLIGSSLTVFKPKPNKLQVFDNNKNIAFQLCRCCDLEFKLNWLFDYRGTNILKILFNKSFCFVRILAFKRFRKNVRENFVLRNISVKNLGFLWNYVFFKPSYPLCPLHDDLSGRLIQTYQWTEDIGDQLFPPPSEIVICKRWEWVA